MPSRLRMAVSGLVTLALSCLATSALVGVIAAVAADPNPATPTAAFRTFPGVGEPDKFWVLGPVTRDGDFPRPAWAVVDEGRGDGPVLREIPEDPSFQIRLWAADEGAAIRLDDLAVWRKLPVDRAAVLAIVRDLEGPGRRYEPGDPGAAVSGKFLFDR